jgi:hypothetical protein
MPRKDRLVLLPVDLTDKWGFHDGDIMDPVLDAWITRSTWASILPSDDPADSPYFSSRVLLAETVTRKLVPRLPEDIRPLLDRVFTVHNPMRVNPVVTDRDMTHEEYEQQHDELRARLERIEPVLLDDDQIDEICQDVFPLRDRGWLAMYDALYWPTLRIDLLPLPDEPSPFDAWDTRYRLVPFVSELAAGYSDDELFLAADIVSNTDQAHITVQVVHDALDSARRVLR